MQPIDLQKYKLLYLQTAKEYFAAYKTHSDTYSPDTFDKQKIDAMFIAIHSIKSQSLVMGYNELGAYCKELEMQLRKYKELMEALTSKDIAYLHLAQEKIKEEILAIEKTGKDLGSTDLVSTIINKQYNKKILLIEDDTFFEQFYSYKLQQIGFTVQVAKNGQEGLQQMQEFLPDVVLLDLIMPLMDGFEVLAKRQSITSIKNIPVIVFSTLGQESDIEKAKSLGANDYVNKSFFDFTTLVNKISKDITPEV